MMIKGIITTALLCIGVVLTAKGIHESSLIMNAIGGFCIGFYNGMVLFGEKLKY